MWYTANVDRETLAYAAGVLDSDGYLGISRNTYHMRVIGDSKAPSYSERICVRQNEATIPEFLRTTFGGSVYCERHRHGNRTLGFRWDIRAKQAAHVIRLVLPFLRLKRQQAELLLALHEDKRLHRPPLTSDVLIRRAVWFEELKALHNHGIKPLAYPAKKPKLL